MSHTPGPWEVSYVDGDWAITKESPDSAVDRTIAFIHNERHWHPELSDAELNANALLIAAAPQLAEALRDLLNARISTKERKPAQQAAARALKAAGYDH